MTTYKEEFNESSRFRLGMIALGVASTFSLGGVMAARAANLTLVHAENFETASEIDTDFWSIETGFFRNHEAQYYTPKNVRISNGSLGIEARHESAENVGYRSDAREWPANVRDTDYTSGSIVSRAAFTFGAFEVVARMPRGAGTWPAIWLISEQGIPYREIDLVETVGSTPGLAFSTIDAGPDLAKLKTWQAQTSLPTLAAEYHTYRLDWSPHAITLSIDARPVLHVDPDEARSGSMDPLRASMHLRINLALGGSWGGRIDNASLPARLDIKSVRVWRLDI